MTDADELREYLDNMSTFSAKVSPEGEILFVNKSAELASGMSPEQLMRTPFLDGPWFSFDPEVHHRVREEFERALAGKVIQADEKVLVAGGQVLEIKLSLTPVFDDEGEVKYVLAEGSDISAQKKLAEQLGKSEARLSEAQQIAHIGSWEWDMIQDKISWSDELFRIFGIQPQNFDGTYDSYLNMIHPDDRELTNKIIQQSYFDFQPFLVEHRIVRPDRETRWVLGHGRVILDEQGKPVRMVGTAQDITERKMIQEQNARLYEAMQTELKERQRAQETLHRSESYFRSLIENALDIITTLDPNGRILFESPAVERVLGYKSEELVGEIAFDYVHPDDLAQVVQKFTEVVKHPGELRSVEFRFKKKSGGWGTLESLGRLVIDYEGKAVVVVNSRDVTERKRAEAEILLLNEELEQRVRDRTSELEYANKELETFSYSVSHDLSTPLRTIDGFSQILLEDYSGKLDEEGRQLLRRMRSASQRMGDLIRDMLNLSRISRMKLERSHVDLSGMVRVVIAELQQNEPERLIELSITEGLAAQADGRLMRIAFDNLLGNAWKFTCKRPVARIDFGLTQQDGRLAYFVRDNGAGFDMAFAQKLFHAFERLHSPDEFEGTGIGLATVQRIYPKAGRQNMGGRQSEPGCDFLFYFVISRMI